MIDAHASAVLALLDAVNDAPALNVHDGKVPSGVVVATSPYVLVYFDSGLPDLTFTGVTHTFELRITCHCVGGGAQAARMVADRVSAALLNVAPAVAGRSCFPIRWEDGAPPLREESTGSTVMDQVDVYVLRSIPA